MCGLAGVAALGGELDRSTPRVAAAMAGTLVHRGPDDEGCWADRKVALAHRRLAVLDLSSNGAQPMESHTGRYVVAFNGEIYNFEELAGRLACGGWQRRGRSDTEVLLAAIEAWGLDGALARCDGMFAFVLYDRAEQLLSLVRDRCGEKPLAYGTHGGRLWFASELRAFAKVPGFDLSLCPDATAAYFRHGYVPGTETIYTAVRRVAPGEIVEVDLGAMREPRSRPYWEVPHPDGSGPGDLLDRLREQLSASVRRRLVSDRPIGALLSGGIDSSLVCALAAEHCSGALKTFTMGWDDAEYDESEQAARVAGALGADHHDVRLGRNEVVDAARRLGTVMDEPFADPSQLGVLLVATQARRDVVVALSGDGGDELFAGYNRHRWLCSLQRLHERVPRWLRGPGGSALRKGAPVLERATRPISPQRRPRLVGDKARKLGAVIAAPSLPAAYQALLAQAPDVGTARELDPDIEAALADGDPDRVLWALRVADLRGFLPDAVLTKVDRATMAVSLESRTPYLEPTVIATAMQLGHDDLLGPGGGKQPLRTLLAGALPGVDPAMAATSVEISWRPSRSASVSWRMSATPTGPSSSETGGTTRTSRAADAARAATSRTSSPPADGTAMTTARAPRARATAGRSARPPSTGTPMMVSRREAGSSSSSATGSHGLAGSRSMARITCWPLSPAPSTTTGSTPSPLGRRRRCSALRHNQRAASIPTRASAAARVGTERGTSCGPGSTSTAAVSTAAVTATEAPSTDSSSKDATVQRPRYRPQAVPTATWASAATTTALSTPTSSTGPHEKSNRPTVATVRPTAHAARSADARIRLRLRRSPRCLVLVCRIRKPLSCRARAALTGCARPPSSTDRGG